MHIDAYRWILMDIVGVRTVYNTDVNQSRPRFVLANATAVCERQVDMVHDTCWKLRLLRCPLWCETYYSSCSGIAPPSSCPTFPALTVGGSYVPKWRWYQNFPNLHVDASHGLFPRSGIRRGSPAHLSPHPWSSHHHQSFHALADIDPLLFAFLALASNLLLLALLS